MSDRLRSLVLTALVSAAVVAASIGLAVAVGSNSEAGPSGGALSYVDHSTPDELLAAYAGKPLVVNFFASWCPPCRAELPDFAAAHAEYGDRVAFVGIDHVETSPQAAEVLLIDSGVAYDIVKDPEGSFLTELARLPVMPTTIFFDAAGNVVNRHAGLMVPDQIRQNVEALLP